MARIRTIKPEFFTSEDIVSLTPLARLLYVGMWCEADREGRFVWKPLTLRLRYLPTDNCDIETVCKEIVQAGLVILYEVDGKTYASIPTFSHHQVINNRESASVLPSPPVNRGLKDFKSRGFDASGTRESGGSGEGKEGREGKGTTCAEGGADEKRDFLWEAMLATCGLDGRQPTKSERGAWNKAVKELRDAGALPEEIPRRAERYREIYPKAALTPTALARHWSACATTGPPTLPQWAGGAL